MKKIKLVIGEEEAEYAKKLASYIQTEESVNMQAAWYGSKDTLLSHKSGKEPEIFLLGSEFWQEEYLNLLLGASNQRILIFLAEDAAERKWMCYPMIFKYQSAKSIVQRIYQVASEYLEDDSVWIGAKKPMTGICAPWNYGLSMLFAMAMAQVVAEEQRVLYVSLQESYGITQLTKAISGADLSDAISFLRKQPKNPGALLKSMIVPVGKADYLPTAENPQNLYELLEEDYRRLIGAIDGQLDYDMVLWESGMLGHGLTAWMERCQVIYCPYQEELFLTEQKRRLEQILKLHEREEFMEKLRFIKLPHISFPFCGDFELEQLQWSELGVFVREQVCMHGV